MIKTIFLTFFFSLISIFSFAQNTKAEFPGGNAAFKKEFLRMVDSYVDASLYAVDGKFTIVIKIDENGKMTDLKIYPKVRNYENFQQDVQFAMEKIKKKWKPATYLGKPVSSSFVFEVNFTTDYADHGD